MRIGAVDFLAKPLSALKLRNIWQHTVRKMMRKMSLDCDVTSTMSKEGGLVIPKPIPADEAAAAAAAAAARCELEAMMGAIAEEPEVEAAEVAAAGECATHGARSSTSRKAQALDDLPASTGGALAPAPAPMDCAAGGSSPDAVDTAANLALAGSSSLYEPSCSSFRGLTSISRSGSSVASELPTPPSAGGVHACPSSRSLASMASCASILHLAPAPASPAGSDSTLLHPAADTPSPRPAAGVSNSNGNSNAGACATQRCMKRAVRHGGSAPGTPASNSNAHAQQRLSLSASKPPPAPSAAAATTVAGARCGPTASLVPSPSTSAAPPVAAATAAPSSMADPSAASVAAATAACASAPASATLGGLPRGMVWGMPMSPLVRAPGIVPQPGAPTSQLPTPSPLWAMMGMGNSMGGLVPAPPAACSAAAAPFALAIPQPGPAAFHHPYMSVSPAATGHHHHLAAPACGAYMATLPAGLHAAADPAAAAAAPVSCLPMPLMMRRGGSLASSISSGLGGVGAGAAAAYSASGSGALNAAALGVGRGGVGMGAGHSAGGGDDAMQLSVEALDAVLGSMTAEDDDLEDEMHALLGSTGCNSSGDLVALGQQHEAALHCSGGVSGGMSAAGGCVSTDSGLLTQGGVQPAGGVHHAQLEHHHGLVAAATRISFDCSAVSCATGAAPHQQQRASSFDCCASTGAAAPGRASSRMLLRPGAGSAHVSFDVISCSRAGGVSVSKKAPAQLLGSMTDLLAASCPAGDSSSEGSADGFTRVDSCGMLADLNGLLGGDPAACGGLRDDGCSGGGSSAAAAVAAGLFDDVMTSLPLSTALRKSSSLAELLGAVPSCCPSPMHE